jgi:hypothetical protein
MLQGINEGFVLVVVGRAMDVIPILAWILIQNDGQHWGGKT